MPTRLAASISGEIAQLEDRYPIALLPVRIETRFNGNALKVRIYPDALHLDRHEPELTDAEYQSGQAYWRAVWGGQSRDAAQEAWRKMLRLFPVQRAAWLVEATTPLNLQSDLTTPGSTPRFPAQQRRETSWDRPVLAQAMPYRWVVILYGADGTERYRAETLPVLTPLAVTFDPKTPPPANADPLTLIRDDPNAGWMVDYASAERLGMAVTIPNLDAADLRDGFSRVLVFGVNTARDAQQSGELLANLFDAHHYTDGFAFVAQGAPTNNIEGLPSAYPPSDPDGRISLDIERGVEYQFTPVLTPEHDGYEFASALRLPLKVVNHVARSRETEQRNAQAMNNALWSATLGYFLEQMLAAGAGENWVNDRPVGWELLPAVRDFFIRWVHGRGPYPAFRVGAVPYGLLPVTSMDRWTWPQTTHYGFDLRLITLNELVAQEWLDVRVTEGRVFAGGQSWRPAQTSTSDEALFYDVALGAALLDGRDQLVTLSLRRESLLLEGVLTIASNGGGNRDVRLDLEQTFADHDLSILMIPSVGVIAGSSFRRLYTVIAYMLYVEGSAQAFFRFQAGEFLIRDTWAWSPALDLESPYEENLPHTALAAADVDDDGQSELILLGAYRDPNTVRSVVYIRIGNANFRDWQDPIVVLDFDSIQSVGLTVADTGELVVFVVGVRSEEVPDVAGFCIVITPSGSIVTRGLFPATAETRAIAASAVRSNPLAGLPRTLTWLRGTWLDASASAQRVGAATTDADVQLATILSRDASAREAYYRSLVGGDFMRGIYAASSGGVLPNGWQPWMDEQNRVMVEILEALGSPFDAYKTRPADQRLRLFDLAFNPASRRFTKALVKSNDQFWINEFMERPPVAVSGSQGNLRESSGDGSSLFQLMLRQSVLLEYYNAAYDLLVQYGVDYAPALRRERELIGMRLDGQDQPTRWSIFDQQLNGQSVGQKLFDERWIGTLAGYFDSFQRLISVPDDELDRLFSETIDLFSHRIDAWITSLAAWRLETMRAPGDTQIYVGAYGWVENLKPEPTPTTEIYRSESYAIQQDNAGYIHAPSSDHAATAAVLRSGYLTRSGVDQTRLALDLSSERVRVARELLDTVRQGQPLGAYLGYRIERRLHEGDLDIYIDPFRRRLPLVPPKDGVTVANGAARNVVDGLALRRYWGDTSVMNWGNDGLPAVGSAGHQALQVALNGELGIDPTNSADARLDPLDAATDLLTAESVYQLVRGNSTGSSAALDALARGMRAPDPEISQTRHSGIPLTHRIALVLDANLPSSWTNTVTPRAAVELRLDAWAGVLLGDPASIACTVTYPTESGLSPVTITLASLGLRPLDMLAFSDQTAELNRRVAYAALGQRGVAETLRAGQLTIDYGAGARGLNFAQALELARALNTVIGAASPLLPKDLLPLDDMSAPTISDEAQARANAAGEQLSSLVRQLENRMSVLTAELGSTSIPLLSELLRAALLQIADFGMAAAVPESLAADDEGVRALLAQADAVLEQAQQRLVDAAAETDPPEKIRALFQRAIPILPLFRLNSTHLQDEPAFDEKRSREAQIHRWLLDAARVRPALDKWRRLWLTVGALSGRRAGWQIAQMPGVPQARWAALEFDNTARPAANLLSIALYRPAGAGGLPTNEWAGLLLDEWIETIPDSEEVTGIAFNYDDPAAEPPQAVLIAVPPTPPASDGSTRWSIEVLERILNETIDLAHIRTVDGEMLGKLGHLLPTMLLAANLQNDTISTTDYEV